MKSRVLFFLLFPLFITGQNRTVIKGRVLYNSVGVKDVLVINNNAQAETRTDSLGNFSIKAAPGDLFIISDYKVESKKIRYTPDQVKNSIFIINVTITATELEELVINKTSITPESLGLVPENQIRYTVAERRLRAEFGFGFDLDRYMKAHEGDEVYKLPKRKQALLKNILTERKMMLIERVRQQYTNEQLVSLFKIPETDIGYFLYYIAEDEDMAKVTDFDDKDMIRFLLTGLAVKYNTIINTDE